MSLNEDMSVFSPPSGQEEREGAKKKEGGEVKMTGPSVPGFYGWWPNTPASARSHALHRCYVAHRAGLVRSDHTKVNFVAPKQQLM